MVKPRLSKSGVSWTDYSWGVVDGCTKVSEACKNCYAEAMITRFHPSRKFSDVQVHPEKLGAPLNTKKPGKVFVAPLGDLFHPDVPFEFIDKVFAVMGRSQHHIFQILTKRPERMLQYFQEDRYQKILNESYLFHGCKITSAMMGAGIDNPKGWGNGEPAWGFSHLWLGVTAENQEQADKRIPILLQIPAAIKFVSVEPMLGPIELTGICNQEWNYDVLRGIRENPFGAIVSKEKTSKLDWVICGGESGPYARPMHPDWARTLRDQCTAAGVAFYFKQWGEYSSEVVQGTKVDVRELKGNQYVAWGDGKTYHIRYTKVGTKKAGNLLDGQTWQQMPEVA